jgi:ABC-type sulfate transport system substrate-binding protein
MKVLLGINEILMGYTTKNNLEVLIFNTREGGPQGIQTWERLMPKREKIVFIVPHKTESKSMKILRYIM